MRPLKVESSGTCLRSQSWNAVEPEQEPRWSNSRIQTLAIITQHLAWNPYVRRSDLMVKAVCPFPAGLVGGSSTVWGAHQLWSICSLGGNLAIWVLLLLPRNIYIYIVCACVCVCIFFSPTFLLINFIQSALPYST